MGPSPYVVFLTAVNVFAFILNHLQECQIYTNEIGIDCRLATDESERIEYEKKKKGKNRITL